MTLLAGLFATKQGLIMLIAVVVLLGALLLLIFWRRAPEAEPQEGGEPGDETLDGPASALLSFLDEQPASARGFQKSAPLSGLQECFAQARHIIVVGDSRSGKTLVAEWLIRALDGQLAILDPDWKVETPPRWGGLPVATRDQEGGPGTIAQILQASFVEFQARAARQLRSEPIGPALLLLWEQADHSSAQLGEDARRVLRRGLQVFHDYRIKLLLTCATLEGLAMTGEVEQAALRQSLVITLGNQARAQVKRLRQERVIPEVHARALLLSSYPALVHWDRAYYGLDTTEALLARGQPIATDRLWQIKTAG